jgi:uncharacterized protein (DUF302 family)
VNKNGAVWGKAEMNTPLKKKIELDFSQALKHLQQLLISNGFCVLTTSNLQKIFREKLGIADYPKCAVVVACLPEVAKAAIDIKLELGFLLPSSFAIYEDNHQVWALHLPILNIAENVGLSTVIELKPLIEISQQIIKKVFEAL